MTSSEGEASPPDAPVTGHGQHRMTVGAGVPREKPPADPDNPKHAAPSGETKQVLEGEVPEEQERYEVVHMRADGTPYDRPKARNISDHPLHKINIEVDDDGNELDGAGPIVKDQYTNPAWRRTWRQSAPQVAVYDLTDPDDLRKYNEMLTLSEPPTAPQKFIIRTQEQFDEKKGSWKVFVMYRTITYKKILKIT